MSSNIEPMNLDPDLIEEFPPDLGQIDPDEMPEFEEKKEETKKRKLTEGKDESDNQKKQKVQADPISEEPAPPPKPEPLRRTSPPEPEPKPRSSRIKDNVIKKIAATAAIAAQANVDAIAELAKTAAKAAVKAKAKAKAATATGKLKAGKAAKAANSIANKLNGFKTTFSNIVKKTEDLAERAAAKLLLNGLTSLKQVLGVLNRKPSVSVDNMIKMIRSEDKESLFGGIYRIVTGKQPKYSKAKLKDKALNELQEMCKDEKALDQVDVDAAIKGDDAKDALIKLLRGVKLPGPPKNKKIARAIAEPYDAGQKQGPVLYGVGTGTPPGSNENYFCYLDDPASKIPRCWALQIPLSFKLGGSGKVGPGVGNAGGGTNHEMEHAIKCVTQAMLNGLSQDTEAKSELGDHTKTHNLLYEILTSIKIVGSEAVRKEMTLTICKLLRKQQVIAGLPSCAIFNQSKCAIDLIKLSLKKTGDKKWFYVVVSPDQSKIKEVSKMIHSANSNEGVCKLAGFDSSRSAWDSEDALARVYEKGGLNKLIPNKTLRKKEIQNAFALRRLGSEETIKLITQQTNKVCSHYNQINNLDRDYSGICIAASILLLDISMNNILATTVTQISAPPGLDELAIRAKEYLEKINLKDLCDKYNRDTDYEVFCDKIKLNKATARYLKFNNAGDFWQDGLRLAAATIIPSQGGGALRGRRRTLATKGAEDLFSEETDESSKKRPRTPTGHLDAVSDEPDAKKLRVIGDDTSDEIKLFRSVEEILTRIYEGGENKDNELDEFEFILNPFSEKTESENIENYANVLINNLFRNELLYGTNMTNVKKAGKTKKKRRSHNKQTRKKRRSHNKQTHKKRRSRR